MNEDTVILPARERRKYNATKHGILREAITDYETQNYQTLYAELEEDLKPESALERLMLERIVINKIKLDRITKAESEVMKLCLNPRVVKPIIDTQWEVVKNEGYSPTLNYDSVAKLETYSRYETQAENRMYKAMQMIAHLRK
jgi:hypothetical protein